MLGYDLSVARVQSLKDMKYEMNFLSFFFALTVCFFRISYSVLLVAIFSAIILVGGYLAVCFQCLQLFSVN